MGVCVEGMDLSVVFCGRIALPVAVVYIRYTVEGWYEHRDIALVVDSDLFVDRDACEYGGNVQVPLGRYLVRQSVAWWHTVTERVEVLDGYVETGCISSRADGRQRISPTIVKRLNYPPPQKGIVRDHKMVIAEPRVGSDVCRAVEGTNAGRGGLSGCEEVRQGQNDNSKNVGTGRSKGRVARRVSGMRMCVTYVTMSRAVVRQDEVGHPSTVEIRRDNDRVSCVDERTSPVCKSMYQREEFAIVRAVATMDGGG
ncbi:hypothetical protein H4582DRAFT_2064410 [Lactarius indigo]|nr:hypothetical protein H4582DRAFT_2064410 [Lactarius indigo]